MIEHFTCNHADHILALVRKAAECGRFDCGVKGCPQQSFWMLWQLITPPPRRPSHPRLANSGGLVLTWREMRERRQVGRIRDTHELSIRMENAPRGAMIAAWASALQLP